MLNNKSSSALYIQALIQDNRYTILAVDVNHLRKVEYYSKEPIAGREHIVKNALSKYGMKIPIVVNRRKDGELVILDGVGRWQVWKELGNKSIPAFVFEEPKEKEEELHVYLNRQASDFDIELLLSKLVDLKPEDFGLESINGEEFDDADHRKKETERWRNNSKGIRRMRFAFILSEYEQIKKDFKSIRHALGLQHDSQLLKWFIDNYNKNNA